MTRRRFAVVGTGARATLYTHALTGEFRDHCVLVALCDVNRARLDYHNSLLAKPVACYGPAAFEAMLRDQRVDTCIICSVDWTHHEYVVRALAAGCDALVEKPLCTTADGCRQILAAVAATGRRVTVGFNYRYSPRNSRVRQLLRDDAIGDVLSIHFEWLLDTTHGADYFRRWHRDKASSGGMLVHKASHHFDLLNWWLDSTPTRVYAVGRLGFYGEAAAAARGEERRERFALSMDDALRALYGAAAVACDGYRRDQDVFGGGVTIEDDMALIVEYASGATVTYRLTCYSPWEGLRVAFNGTRGRLEYEVAENTCVAGAAADPNLPHRPAAPRAAEVVRIAVHPHFEAPTEHAVDGTEPGHGGGDARMLRDLFLPSGDGATDPLGRAADHLAGVAAVSVGIAANASLERGAPVVIAELLGAQRAPWPLRRVVPVGAAIAAVAVAVVLRAARHSYFMLVS